jgi:hypothetical protein
VEEKAASPVLDDDKETGKMVDEDEKVGHTTTSA